MIQVSNIRKAAKPSCAHGRAVGLIFLLRTEEAMLTAHPTGTEPDKQSPDPQAGPLAIAERALRNGPYPALKKLSCDYQGGVVVLRGCLPTYYLKQIAQEVVAQQVQGMGGLDNQIQVARVAVLETPPALDTDEVVEESRRETSPRSERRTWRVVAPYGEEIEVDG
jgi:hypothetical protein